MVGDLIGSGESEERGVVSATPHLAARLQAVAEPDSIVISDDTQRLLGSLFDLRLSGRSGSRAIPAPRAPGKS
jgi:class 3 adenylate cyclase